MKRVLQIEPDTAFRFIFPDDDALYELADWKFNGESRIGKIGRFSAHFDTDSDDPVADITYVGMAAFAMRKEVATELVELWEGSAELIPFDVEGELWYILNVTKTLDGVLAIEQSEFRVPKLNVGIKKAVFIKDKLPKSCIFKIPEGRYTETFCIDSREDDEDVMNNLFCAIEAKGYTGLKFKEMSVFK